VFTGTGVQTSERVHATIGTAIGRFSTAFVALRHELVAITSHASALVPVPAMTVFEMAEAAGAPLGRNCQLHVDLTPPFVPSA